MSTATKYDARTGFHDVKGLIDSDSSLVGWILIGSSCAPLILLLLLARRRRAGRPVERVRTAREFLDRLRNVEKQFSSNAIDARSAASVVSQTVREYLEVKKSLPALELTPLELVREFERAPESLRLQGEPVVDLVRSCERVSFAEEEIPEPKLIQSFVTRAEQLISTLESKGGA